MVARILLGQDARLQESEGLVEDGPERGVVAAVSKDARRDLDVLGGKVVEVGLLDDFGTCRESQKDIVSLNSKENDPSPVSSMY